MCHYFDDMINGTKINLNNILLDKKLYENISVCYVFLKTTTGLKPFCTRLHKIDRFIIALDGKIKHLIVFDYRLFNRICGKIKCLISKKVVLEIVLIIISVRRELIPIILYLLKKY